MEPFFLLVLGPRFPSPVPLSEEKEAEGILFFICFPHQLFRPSAHSARDDGVLLSLRRALLEQAFLLDPGDP